MKKIFTLIAVFILSGCSQVTEHFTKMANETSKNMTYVFNAGYKIADNGKSIPIFGVDKCNVESKNSRMDFLMDSSDTSNSCIVITPKTEEVLVGLIVDKKPVYEKWRVIRKSANETAFVLLRPNGAYVTSFAG